MAVGCWLLAVGYFISLPLVGATLLGEEGIQIGVYAEDVRP